MTRTIANSYSCVNSILRISSSDNLRLNIGMEIKEIRRRNLILLIESRERQSVLAAELKMAPSILSNIVTGARDMGHGIARRIEKRLLLEPGWMDSLREKMAVPDRLRAQLLHLYENLSQDGRDALIGKANSLYIMENPDPSPANPFGKKKTKA